MDRTGRPKPADGPAAAASEAEIDSLPHDEEEFARELGRRLVLLDREIEGLGSSLENSGAEGRTNELRAARRTLRGLLSGRSAAAEWTTRRAEILAAWHRYRGAFEALTAACRLRHEVRPGQRDRGPKW